MTLEVVREGWLYKQSKYLKEWRKYVALRTLRRWFVITPTRFYTFKECKKYEKPTETIEIVQCKTIKSAEDETNRKFAFVIKQRPNPT